MAFVTELLSPRGLLPILRPGKDYLKASL